ncbi:MAG: OmpA family protein [Pseudomonadota bacterium]
MKRFLLTGVALGLVAVSAPQAEAADSSKKEVAGAGAGAVIGGAVGGPPGAIIGAAVGALFGDRSHQKDLEVARLDDTVTARDATIDGLETDLARQRVETTTLRDELTAIDDSGARELHELLVRGLEIELPYRTDETDLPVDMQARLTAIASLLATTPGLSVQVDGYADPRGSVDYNQALSLARAERVRELISAVGIDSGRITTFGHGESMTAVDSTTIHPDQLALQRRVTVTFYREPTAAGVAALGGGD